MSALLVPLGVKLLKGRVRVEGWVQSQPLVSLIPPGFGLGFFGNEKHLREQIGFFSDSETVQRFVKELCRIETFFRKISQCFFNSISLMIQHLVLILLLEKSSPIKNVEMFVIPHAETKLVAHGQNKCLSSHFSFLWNCLGCSGTKHKNSPRTKCYFHLLSSSNLCFSYFLSQRLHSCLIVLTGFFFHKCCLFF